MAQDNNKQLVLGSLAGLFVGFINSLFKGIRLYIILLISFSMLAVGYYLWQKPAYEAKVNFILEEKSSGLASGLSGIASTFGIDIAGLSGGGSLFSGDNVLDILQSRRIINEVLLSRVDSVNKINGPTLADLYFSFSNLGLSSRYDTLGFAKLHPGQPHSAIHDSVLGLIYDRLVQKQITAERQNKKGSIIAFTVTTPNQEFSKLFAERVVAQTKQLYMNVKTGFMASNVAKLEAKADSILRLANTKSFQSAGLQILDANEAYRQATVPAELSQRDRLLNNTLYAEVVKNLEAARLTLASQTPVMQLLDEPVYPLQDKRKGILKLLLMAIGAATVLYIVLTFVQIPPSKANP
jgi:hypothetical protein